MNAALFLCLARCLSTQLYEAFSFPPTNQLKNGGFDVSRMVCQSLSHESRSEYSRKQFGKFFSLNRSNTPGSAMLAWATNSAGGCRNSSSFQCEAIEASLTAP